MARRPSLEPVLTLARKGLVTAAKQQHVHRAFDVVQRELKLAMFPDEAYGSRYYGDNRNQHDREGLSGYERYDRASSNANAAAWLLWRTFEPVTHLDVGCAVGYVVEAMREAGVDSWGSDISGWAVDHATTGALGRLRRGDLTKRLPYRSGLFDVVSALETLEHLPPEAIPHALGELRRVCRGYVVATIPSFGPRDAGLPDGWFEAKIPDELLDRYRGYGPSYEGPIPYDDLKRDVEGNPIEGHLTIASFSWWRKRFEEAGFVRMPDVERRLFDELCKLRLDAAWNLYAFRIPEVAEPRFDVRTQAELEVRATAWQLADVP